MVECGRVIYINRMIDLFFAITWDGCTYEYDCASIKHLLIAWWLFSILFNEIGASRFVRKKVRHLPPLAGAKWLASEDQENLGGILGSSV